jgi:hypothetical protein
MKAKWILAALLVITTSALAQAGGPPPMYVVVDKVVFEPDKRVSGWIQIWGTFTRTEKVVDKAGNSSTVFSKPIYGYVYLSLPKNYDSKLIEELKDWEKSAGSGKAVTVGSCGDAGSMLKVPIHQPNETVTLPDAVYTTEFLRLWGDLYATGQLANQPEVKALLKYAKERK